MNSYRIGDVEVTRVVEFTGVLFTRDGVLAASPREVWEANRDWLEPAFWNHETDEITVAIQTFVLVSDGKTILIDTGIGNDKERPDVPPFHQQHRDFLERLAAAGVSPEDVDFVICTHLHPDHVGWNTVLENGEWVPTFPNARYVINRAEYEFWDPANGFAQLGPHAEDHVHVFNDSVAPVNDQLLLWENSYEFDSNITLTQVPGHTPGSTIVEVHSGGEHAVFVGDLVGSPMMICDPGLYAQRNGRTVDHDPELLVEARLRVLGEAADSGTTVIPAHFDCDYGVRVSRAASGFGLTIITKEKS